jgi:hypothetical protein
LFFRSKQQAFAKEQTEQKMAGTTSSKTDILCERQP